MKVEKVKDNSFFYTYLIGDQGEWYISKYLKIENAVYEKTGVVTVMARQIKHIDDSRILYEDVPTSFGTGGGICIEVYTEIDEVKNNLINIYQGKIKSYLEKIKQLEEAIENTEKTIEKIQGLREVEEGHHEDKI